jgi:hypothetical protein
MRRHIASRLLVSHATAAWTGGVVAGTWYRQQATQAEAAAVEAPTAPATATSPALAVPAVKKANHPAAPDFDPKSVDPQRLMVVTTKYLQGNRRSRPAAQRLLDCIQEKIDLLPSVFLADVAAGSWPTGLLSDSLRVAIRRRVAKGALDLNGTDVARVFVSWAQPEEQRGDVVLFKRLGRLLAHSINDIRDAALLADVLVAIRRARLKPPPGFVSLLARRVVALDRVEPLDTPSAVTFLKELDHFDALDTPTATALVNRIVTGLRKSIERVVANRQATLLAAGSAGSTKEATADKERPVETAEVAKKAGVAMPLRPRAGPPLPRGERTSRATRVGPSTAHRWTT